MKVYLFIYIFGWIGTTRNMWRWGRNWDVDWFLPLPPGDAAPTGAPSWDTLRSRWTNSTKQCGGMGGVNSEKGSSTD